MLLVQIREIFRGGGHGRSKPSFTPKLNFFSAKFVATYTMKFSVKLYFPSYLQGHNFAPPHKVVVTNLLPSASPFPNVPLFP